MADTNGTTIVNASCHCKSFTTTLKFPNSDLPFDRAICVCNMCRTSSGACGISAITLKPGYTSFDPADYKLSKYWELKEGYVRYFCSICSCHICVEHAASGERYLSTGLWDKTEGIMRWTGSKFIPGTGDGGISIWLRDIVEKDGSVRKLDRCSREITTSLVPEVEYRSSSHIGRTPEPNTKLQAQCHCKKVKFHITRPNEDSKKAESPYPDLMKPYRSSSSANPSRETWWLRSNSTKYLAGLCACPSCRLTLGYDIQSWAFVPMCNIFNDDGTPLDFNNMGLTTYASSAGVMRESCGKCGATVFWHCEERPDIIDVSVGLLDPEEGARADAWLDWRTGRVSFAELAVSTSLVGSLERGMKVWKIEQNAK
ncbi:Mss4-like protein [Amylocarpus encephaloides]|uniref:Mss4-like protein n=1 Tax=Amylocarpus encephaloides TaxID=45428 RepID=A0A9P8C5T8_9HELO|nr:Mss4-like protein [Amylocarpus encephaloides]